MAGETVTIMGQGITLDLLLWRKWGDRGQSLVADTLTLNPGLAACGVELPLGTQVVLPAGPAAEVETLTATDLFG
ncbi:tail protein X [Xanthobacter sediminis]